MRHLDWDGCCNARDLGGLRTRDGREILRGALVRADALDRLSRGGWDALHAHGVRTVIDLRNEDERGAAVSRPPDLTTVHLALDGMEYRDFWDYWENGPQFGTPLYYGPFLQRFPDRVVSVIAAIARARPGGVLFHCSVGRDRTGLVAVILLSLLGVGNEDIADDYVLGADRVPALASRNDRTVIEAFLSGHGTSARGLIISLLESLDVEAYLLGAGLTHADIDALRARAFG